MEYYAARRERLRSGIAPELDALLVSNPLNVTYLTGFSGESSHLVLSRDRTVLVSDGRFTEQLAAECRGLETHIRPPTQTIHQAVAEVLGKLGYRRIGFESAALTVADLEMLCEGVPGLAWKPERDRVEQLRVIKDEREIAAIREAIAIAERAFTAFRALLRPEDNEKNLSDALEHHVRHCGGKCTSFPSIVAVGDRSALPHAPPTKRTVAEADFLLVDWGASGPFYKSDLTRILATHTISPKLEHVYQVVLTAQERAIRSVRPGVKGHEVDAEARAVIAQEGFGDAFKHGLGHGIGLQVHEAPALRPNSDIILQPGMVVTVEPGIYLPGWGGVRIEDDVLVTKDGCEVLTSVPKDMATICCRQ